MEQRCGGTRFRWSLPVEQAIGLVEEAPDRYARLLADGVGPRSKDPDRWSATGYLWHVVDVIQFGTERLWTLTFDPESGVLGWDQDAMARIRNYEQLARGRDTGTAGCGPRLDSGSNRCAPFGPSPYPILGNLTTGGAIKRNAHEVHHHELDIRRALET
jgi:hypothetical protein